MQAGGDLEGLQSQHLPKAHSGQGSNQDARGFTKWWNLIRMEMTQCPYATAPPLRKRLLLISNLSFSRFSLHWLSPFCHAKLWRAQLCLLHPLLLVLEMPFDGPSPRALTSPGWTSPSHSLSSQETRSPAPLTHLQWVYSCPSCTAPKAQSRGGQLLPWLSRPCPAHASLGAAGPCCMHRAGSNTGRCPTELEPSHCAAAGFCSSACCPISVKVCLDGSRALKTHPLHASLVSPANLTSVPAVPSSRSLINILNKTGPGWILQYTT